MLALPAGAQSLLPAPQESSTQAPAAVAQEVIDTAAIVDRADTDERLAIAALERAAAQAPIAPLTSELEAITRSVDARLHQFSATQLRHLPIMRLETLDRYWAFDSKRFGRWRERLRAETTPYAHDAAEVARRRIIWQHTREVASDLPPVMLARMEALIALQLKAEQALAIPLAGHIALGARANALETRIDEGRNTVAGAIAAIDRRLFQLDAPPLWRLQDQPSTDADASQSLMTGLQIESDFAKAYTDANPGNQLALHVMQFALLTLLLLGWHRSRPLIKAGQMEATAARVLGRPLSTWLLICAAATMVLEPDAPILTRQLWMLLALIPVLRLLPPSSHRLLDHWPFVATVLYLLAGLGFFFLANSLVFRLYTLGLTCASLAATAWLLWRAYRHGHADHTGSIGKALRVTACLAAGLFVISLVVNLVGNISLSEMLTNAVIDSAYMGLLLYVCIAVVLTLLHLALNRPGLLQSRLGRTHAPPLMQLLRKIAIFSAIAGWFVYTAECFRIRRPGYAVISQALGHEFQLGEFSLSLGHVLAFLVAIWLAFWASRVTRLLLGDVIHGRPGISRGVGSSIASLASYAVLLLGMVVALSAAGIKSSQLALIFGALGVGIGFGLQNVVNNFVSGLILMFERPIQPGDVVEIGTTSGRVREIGMRATRIKTFEGADVVVPNGTLLSERLTNWTLSDRHRRIDLDLGVAYGSDPGRVIDLLVASAAQTQGIADAPPPGALFTGFGDSALTFSLRAWTYDFDNWTSIRSALLTRVNAALAEAGIEIPFPQRDVHLHMQPNATMPAATGD